MEIIRDNEGRIVRIIKEESDGDFNVADVFKAEIETDKDFNIAKEKEITLRTKEKCNFFRECTSIAATVAKAVIVGIDEYNRQQSLNNNALNSQSEEEVY